VLNHFCQKINISLSYHSRPYRNWQPALSLPNNIETKIKNTVLFAVVVTLVYKHLDFAEWFNISSFDIKINLKFYKKILYFLQYTCTDHVYMKRGSLKL
jgi:hypothetical protein